MNYKLYPLLFFMLFIEGCATSLTAMPSDQEIRKAQEKCRTLGHAEYSNNWNECIAQTVRYDRKQNNEEINTLLNAIGGAIPPPQRGVNCQPTGNGNYYCR